jgi:hypothetical protein
LKIEDLLRRPRVVGCGSIIVGLLLVVGAAPVSAIELSSFELFFGGAWNADSTLTVRQQGHPDIELTAEWDTRPFEQPLYWAFRFGFNRNDLGAWELQFIHHKIYLVNTTEELASFEITHGFNILSFNRSFESLPVNLRVGAGLVLAHPDSVVRDEHSSGGGGLFGTGYELTGPVIMAGVGKDFDLSSRFFVDLELQLTVGWVDVPVFEGEASTTNVALHWLVGAGYRF